MFALIPPDLNFYELSLFFLARKQFIIQKTSYEMDIHGQVDFNSLRY